MSNYMRTGIFAIILVIISTFLMSCGGGSGPIVPHDDPEPTIITIIQDDRVEAWRLQLTDTNFKPGGRSIYEYMPISQKIIDIYPDQTRNLQYRLEGRIDGRWFLYTGIDTARLDVRQVGIESGVEAPMLASSPPHDSAFTDRLTWPVAIHSGTGVLAFVATVYDEDLNNDDTGILCYLHFNLRLNASSDPQEDPPYQETCRDIHPTREAIDGYWWDCINNDWVNTGELVDPLSEDPDLIGRWYEGSSPRDVDSDGDVITIEFGTEIPLMWFWRFADMTTEDILSSQVTFDDTGLITPFWVWVGDGLLHALTDNGNESYTYLDVGEWDLNFSSPGTYGEVVTYHVALRVVEQHSGQSVSLPVGSVVLHSDGTISQY
ncbi:MAG: hypothetical protein U9M89_02645 [Patescibacteria group bacterium]|nr:hypothetical protein [Patescibacteria group bacterium]